MAGGCDRRVIQRTTIGEIALSVILVILSKIRVVSDWQNRRTFAPCKQVAILAAPRHSSNEFDSALGLHRIVSGFQNVMNMKNFALILMSLLMVCCTKDDEVKAATVQEAGKTLVVYYSYTNNCHEIVTSLTSQIQADVMRIEPADKTQKYEANNYAIGTALLNAIKAAPNDAASYPAIDPVSITDLSQYQNIIIVTPLWWSQMAAIMQTYLFNYDAQMAGKHVALIVSSHSSGISGVVADAKRLVPDALWMGDALWINANNHSNRASLIQSWLPTLNFASGTTGINGTRSADKADGAYYSLNGQRVVNPTKGLYIRNGKKVIL